LDAGLVADVFADFVVDFGAALLAGAGLAPADFASVFLGTGFGAAALTAGFAAGLAAGLDAAVFFAEVVGVFAGFFIAFAMESTSNNQMTGKAGGHLLL